MNLMIASYVGVLSSMFIGIPGNLAKTYSSVGIFYPFVVILVP